MIGPTPQFFGRKTRSLWPDGTVRVALVLWLVVASAWVSACGSDPPRDAADEPEDPPELPNPFDHLRPRAGDVLVPPLIGFRWDWNHAGSDEPGSNGLAQGEFSPLAGRTEAGGPGETPADDEDPPDGVQDDDSEDDAGSDTQHRADSSEPEDPDAPPDLEGGDQPSERDRVDAYPIEGPAPSRVVLPEDPLFRVVLVDSIGAIYARVITTATSVRVPLPPNTGPGPYWWYVEQLAPGDSTLVAKSVTETFEIR